MNKTLFQYVLLLADNPLILGHRLSQLCGHGPSLETDIALTNISLDLFGQVRNYLQYAAKVQAKGKTEDDLAFLRFEHEYRNVLLVEQANFDFAWVIARQYLFDVYHQHLLQQLCSSVDAQLAAIAQKSLKEVQYHHQFSTEWMRRLGDGTEESNQRMQTAIQQLWSYVDELFYETTEEREMRESGTGADLGIIKPLYLQDVEALFQEAGIAKPEGPWHRTIGKEGVHTENLGFILAELQFMQRAYPNMQW